MDREEPNMDPKHDPKDAPHQTDDQDAPSAAFSRGGQELTEGALALDIVDIQTPSPVTREQRRSRRKRAVRARTISVKRMTKRELELGRLLYPDLDDIAPPEARADCVGGARPCPYVSCKHHLYLDVSARTGAIKLNKPVTGMVRFGNGYLMVGEDGGIFSFSDKKFLGSLGNNPPAHPITSVAVLDAPAAAQ